MTSTTHTSPHCTCAQELPSAAQARARIDELDAEIIALVQKRRAASTRVDQTRTGSGARRAGSQADAEGQGVLAREMEVLGRYRDALGPSGTQLAMTLRGLCRGQL